MGTTNTLDLNNRVTKLEKAVSGGDSAQANKKDIATEFSATTAYTAGCFVYYGGKLYQFNVDHAAGAWDPTDVVEANVTDQIASNKAAIEGLTASDIMMSDGVTSVEDKVDELTNYVVDTTTISGVTITKMGHLVTLVIDKTITMSGSSWVSVGTVPYKPTTEIYGVAKKDADDKIISIDLTTKGALAVMGSSSSTMLVRGSLTYITND